MPESPPPERFPVSLEKGPHYPRIKQRLPDWLSSAAPPRLSHLSAANFSRPTWYNRANAHLHQAVKEANAHAWRTQNSVDQRLARLQDVYAFAEPLLKNAIAQKYHLNLDVKNTFLHLYLPKKLPWYAHDFFGGTTIRNVSLLDAALHNFARGETFDPDSCYISRPDYRGHFTLIALQGSMSIEQFKALCRELDLGAHYQQHLKQHLLPADINARSTLRNQVMASQKAALKAAAKLARLKADLSASSHATLMRVLRGEHELLQFYQLSILDAPLTGILLIAADIEHVSGDAKLMAYIPHDPLGPLKEYDSNLDFMHDLTRKLQNNAPLPSRQHLPCQTYQQFFSQFIDHSQRGYFFAGLEQRLCKVQWHRKGPLDPRPSWRNTPVDKPRLQFDVQKIDHNPWRYLYRQAVNKILNDGRSIAVSSADADSNARAAWWDNFTRIITDIFNVALLVAAPFVPFLGELMLAYTAYQLADDVLEGLVDLAEGQAIEATGHFVAVANDVVQLGALGAGGTIARELMFRRSPFVDSLEAVQVNGEQRLWNPDPAPYAHPELQLPPGARPDELGLHEHQGEKVLRLDDRHYVVQPHPTTEAYYLKHPTRPTAYSPRLAHNGHGAWVLEGEHPRSWDTLTLRRRLGPIVEGLSAEQLEQACDISGTQDNALRMMYSNREPAPPLLRDSLKRLQLQEQTTQLVRSMRTGAPVDQSFYWSAQTASELPGWPADKAIRVFQRDDLTGSHMTYGAAQANTILEISQRDLLAGKLPERILAFLPSREIAELLPGPLSSTPAGRISALRHRLAEQLARRNKDVFLHLYSVSEALDSPQGRLLQQHYPTLPKSLLDTLLIRASPNELALMGAEQKIPLRLKNLARELNNEALASRAYEGFYNDAELTPDTERMALNILRLNTDALGNQRIAVHARSSDGPLRCQVGPDDAPVTTLIRMDNGHYQIPASPAQYDFYEALLRTLPADKVEYVPGQGRIFKQWLMEQLQPPAERRTALEPSTQRQADSPSLQTLLQRPMLGAFRRLFQREPLTQEQRVSRLLPRLDEEQVRELVNALKNQPDPALLNTEEAAKRQLLEKLDAWRSKPTFGARYSTLASNETLMRGFIIRELQMCWETGAYQRMAPPGAPQISTLLDLSELVLGRYIRSLDPLQADFSHVTRLDLTSTRLSNADLAFLDNFPQLQALSLSDNHLDSVPVRLKNFARLTSLNLRDNPITWHASDYETLNQCRHLRRLGLEGHSRLAIAPDLRALPDLSRLILRRTSISQWPEGIDSPRKVIPELDMTHTQIKTVPRFAADSQAARTIARSWLDRSKLEPEDEERFIAYRRAAGIDPYRTAPPGGAVDAKYWMYNLHGQTRIVAQQIWDDLEAEQGSQGFFDMLKLLRPPEAFQTDTDAQLFQQGYEDLISRVWDLLIAVDRDPVFRERMFSLAGAPANCADAGAHIFNRMGVETLLNAIQHDTSADGLAKRESRLVNLARQSWHLEQVNELARQEVQRRTAPVNEGGLGQAFGSDDNQVDDVQVYLAYQTGLKTRLDLPWLSEHMVYRNTARVSASQLDAAYRSILDKEQGDGLVNGLLGQLFWDDYLHETYQAQFQAQHAKREIAGSQLEDLLDAHHQWLAPQLSAEDRIKRRQQLLSLADDLVLPHSSVLTEEDFSQATVQRFYEHIQHDYNELARRLTRQALQATEPSG